MMSMPMQATGRMDVFRGVSLGIEHARAWLFRPFDFGKWVSIGVIIFLDVLFGNGMNYGYNNGFHGSSNGDDLGQVGARLQEAEAWVMTHFALIAVIAMAIVLIIAVMLVLFTYLTSRGQLMFVRATARCDHRIDVNWCEVKPYVMSLFWFRLVLSILSFVLALVVLVVGYLSVRGLLLAGGTTWVSVLLALIPAILLFVLVSLVFGVLVALLRSFVVPIMLACDLPCTQAWREFFSVASGNWLSIIGFLLLNIVFSMIAGFASMLAGCLTCCIGFLPVISHTILAPYYVFQRAWPMYMLAMVDERYNLFAVAEEAPALPVE